ncbi:hypothetical protein J1N35_019012 [Gossypium stocksii]|uniref:Uncharacterized protein n=1 Tax=Gossypium stocksii TaxID=47602 RepID=A0A9D3VRJ3_9ROSI|nr:hypothetical protein J1N35_019012 [Gossypium stocksii]
MGKKNRPLKCFFCEGSHMLRDYPKRSVFSIIREYGEPKKALMRLGSIVHRVEAKRGNENKEIPVKYFLCCGPHRM